MSSTPSGLAALQSQPTSSATTANAQPQTQTQTTPQTMTTGYMQQQPQQAAAPSSGLSFHPLPVTATAASANTSTSTSSSTAPPTFTAATPLSFTPLNIAPQTLSTQQSTTHTSQPLAFQAQPAFTLQAKPLTFAPLPGAAPSTNSAPLSLQPMTMTQSAPSATLSAAASQTSFQPVSSAPSATSTSAPTAATTAAAAAAPSTAASSSLPPVPEIIHDLPIVDDEAAFDQCQDWSFFVELLGDIFNTRDEMLAEFEASIETNNHFKFKDAAHAQKGAALNLHLPALVDITKKAEIVGKQLMATPDAAEYLAMRRPMLEHFIQELKRLEAVIPLYQQKAEEEAGEEGF